MSTSLLHQSHRPTRSAPAAVLAICLTLLCATLLCAGISLPAQAASERLFPTNVKRGTLVPRDPPDIIIDGKPRFLASGARIRDANNHLQHLSRIQGEQFIINYTENHYGDINQIWILTPEEIRTPIPNSNATPTPKPQPRPIQNNQTNQNNQP